MAAMRARVATDSSRSCLCSSRCWRRMDACSGRIGNLKRLRHRERARRFELRNELFTRQKQIVIRRLVSAWLACVAIGGCKGVTDSGTGASEALYAITVLPGFAGDTTAPLDPNPTRAILAS